MTLDQFLEETGETGSAFAERTGVSIATVSRVRRGKCRPDWATMDAIYHATSGRVTPNDYGIAPVPAAA